MRIEKREENKEEKKDYIEILEAVKISQEHESILLEPGDRIQIIESGDPGSVFIKFAKNFRVDIDIERVVRGEYFLRVRPNSFVNLSRHFDDILKGFYSEVSDRWNVIWDQDNDEEIVKIF